MAGRQVRAGEMYRYRQTVPGGLPLGLASSEGLDLSSDRASKLIIMSCSLGQP